MMELKEQHCGVLKAGTKPFNSEQVAQFISRLATGWEVVDNKKIRKSFPFENFKRGMAFAQELALWAEEENHHPDICIHYTNVEVELSTHDVGGLTLNDFIMAAKIDDN